MRCFQFVAVALIFVVIFQDADAKPMEVSNVDCAGEYLTCLDRENDTNPMGMQSVTKTCKAQIRELPICAGLPAYRTEDHMALG